MEEILQPITQQLTETTVATNDVNDWAFNQDGIYNPRMFQHLKDIAMSMSKSSLIPEPFRNKPADCFIAVQQAHRWGYDPYSVVRNSFVTKGIIGYTGVLIHSVLRTQLKEKLRYDITGSQDDLAKMVITVTNITDKKEEEESITVFGDKIATKFSPLWKTDPAQQLSYYATRVWVRRYRPEILLGVYSDDEVKTIDVTESKPTINFEKISFKTKGITNE